MFWDSTFLFLIPAFVFALYAQNKVKSTYRKYLDVRSARGMTGAEAAGQLLNAAGVGNVTIETVPGELTDHYDPRARVLRLSEANHGGTSVSALGVACHEAGHALQHAAGYGPLELRQRIFPVANIGSKLAMPLFFSGFLFSYPVMMDIGIVVYMVAAFFTVLTLPVEFDASNRAVTLLNRHGIVTPEESGHVKAVLNAAALTYVAAALMAVLQLVRLIVLRGRR